jgi:hypothetical protein
LGLDADGNKLAPRPEEKPEAQPEPEAETATDAPSA